MAAPADPWAGTRLRPLRCPGVAPALWATSVHEAPSVPPPDVTAATAGRAAPTAVADDAIEAAVRGAAEALLGGAAPPDELVFSGGGVRGWAYVGLLEGFEAAGCDLLARATTFVGSSIGAAFALACALRVGAAEARAVFRKTLDALGEPSLAGLMVGGGGMVSTEGIEAAMRGVLRRAVGRDRMTFRQLLDERGVTLGVTYVDIVTKRTALCGPLSAPHEDIVSCVVDSMRIFPVLAARRHHATFTCRVDGGFGDNLPLRYTRPGRSLGFLLCGATSLGDDALPGSLDAIGTATVFSRTSALVLEGIPDSALAPESRGRVVRIDTSGVSTMALDAPPQTVDHLVSVGARVARAIAATLATRASAPAAAELAPTPTPPPPNASEYNVH